MVNTNNLALVTVNRQPAQNPVGYYFVADNPVSNGYIRSDSVSIDTVFPLFVFREDFGKQQRVLNLNAKIVGEISRALGLQFVEDAECDRKTSYSAYNLFDYVYAVLYSDSYRNKYAEYLKIDFPRIPIPYDQDVFWILVDCGAYLRRVHLLQCEEELQKYAGLIQFVNGGNTCIEKSASSAFKDGRVYINKSSWFEGIRS